MNILDIIDKKSLGEILSKEEIQYVIDNYLNDIITDYQMSSLLMAICINGMNEEETINLTNSMLNSSERIDLSSINGIKVELYVLASIYTNLENEINDEELINCYEISNEKIELEPLIYEIIK